MTERISEGLNAGGDQTAPAVLTRAVLRAASELGLADDQLAAVLEIKSFVVETFAKGEAILAEGSREWENSVSLLKLHAALESLVGGDALLMRQWLWTFNMGVEAVPGEEIARPAGLARVVRYLASSSSLR